MDQTEENEILKRKLKNAQKWMTSQVQEDEKRLCAEKTKNKKDSFYSENIESLLEDQICSFFPREVLMSFPDRALEQILSSELIYYHFRHTPNIDGVGVILGYQKVLDSMIELYITKGFRKYITKNKLSRSAENTQIEKALQSVIDKKHIISLGRLYGILDHIKKGNHQSHYLLSFHNYLKSRPSLEKCLLESSFFLQLESLTHMHAINEKRHNGILSFDDTTKCRALCTGNFKDTDCLIYTLGASQKTDI